MNPESCQRAIAKILEQCLLVYKAEGSRREHFAYKQAYHEVYEIIKEERKREDNACTSEKASCTGEQAGVEGS